MSEKPEALELFLALGSWLEIGGIGEAERFVPQLKALEDLEDAATTVLCAASTLANSVQPGMARIGEEAPGHSEGIVGPAQVHPVTAEPLVVMGVVVNLIGENAAGDHIVVISAGGGLLREGGVVPALELGVDVSRHVPHMGDPGSGVTELGGRIEGDFGLLVVPQVDAVVVRRVPGIHREDLLQDGVHRLVTVDG